MQPIWSKSIAAESHHIPCFMPPWPQGLNAWGQLGRISVTWDSKPCNTQSTISNLWDMHLTYSGFMYFPHDTNTYSINERDWSFLNHMGLGHFCESAVKMCSALERGVLIHFLPLSSCVKYLSCQTHLCLVMQFYHENLDYRIFTFWQPDANFSNCFFFL